MRLTGPKPSTRPTDRPARNVGEALPGDAALTTEAAVQPLAAAGPDTTAAASFVRPYPPSWLHGLLDRLDRLPGPVWLTYTVIAVLMVLAVHTQPWARGTQPVGVFDLPNVYWGLLPVALLWSAGYLDRVAGSAFDAFRPALSLPDADAARLRYELTVVPRDPSIAIAVVTAVLTVGSYALDPVATGVAGVPGPVLAGRLALESFNGAILFVLIYQLLRQMRQVSRTLARSAAVDLFKPGPLYAFSKLTSRTGIVLVLLVASSSVIAPPTVAFDSQSFLLLWAPYLFLPSAIAVIAFVVPLYGMHGRLVAEKERLQDDAEARLQRVLTETNQAVDGRDFARIDGLNKALASLLQEREILAKLPTWPWSTGTFRGFVSAILLPLGLFLVQQALGRLL